jgi:hypothetical protein
MLGLAEMAWKLAWWRVYGSASSPTGLMVSRFTASLYPDSASCEYYRIIDTINHQRMLANWWKGRLRLHCCWTITP